MKAEILNLLKETKDFVSGQELCEHFQVSRTAIWKAVRQLEEEGYRIEAVRNRGYRLMGRPNAVTAAEISEGLHTKWLGREICYYDSVDSTNQQVKRLADQGAVHGTLVTAESQTSGKGRRGRGWSSPAGTGAWMSFLLRPSIDPNHASMLTLVAALAVCNAVRDMTGLSAKIKWPNDIVINGKKLCGILTEMSTEELSIHYVVVGIGVNVNQSSFPDEIKQRATSLKLEGGRDYSRAELICRILEHFEHYYELFLETEDLGGMAEEYNGKCVNAGREVCVLSPGGEYTGVSLGIDFQGDLLVKRDGGQVEKISSGEVSVRGIYGYV